MKLTFSPASPFARKVRIAAIELGLIDKIEFVPATIVPGRPNDEYSKINPVKKLPALILDNGEVIVDSYVIVEYLDELAGGGKLIPASGPTRWRVKSDHSLLQGMLDSMLLCRYEKMVRPQGLQWQAWSDDHWNRAWKGMAHFEKQPEMLARPFDIAQIGLIYMRARLRRFPLRRLRLAQSLSEARCLPRKDAGAVFGENLAAAAGLIAGSCHESQAYRRRSHHPSHHRAGNHVPAGAGHAARPDAGGARREQAVDARCRRDRRR